MLRKRPWWLKDDDRANGSNKSLDNSATNSNTILQINLHMDNGNYESAAF